MGRFVGCVAGCQCMNTNVYSSLLCDDNVIMLLFQHQLKLQSLEQCMDTRRFYVMKMSLCYCFNTSLNYILLSSAWIPTFTRRFYVMIMSLCYCFNTSFNDNLLSNAWIPTPPMHEYRFCVMIMVLFQH